VQYWCSLHRANYLVETSRRIFLALNNLLFVNYHFQVSKLILMPIQQLYIKNFERKDGNPPIVNENLMQNGCWALVTIHPPEGSTTPPIQGYALVDTGTTYCCIRGDIIDSLKIQPNKTLSETSGMAGKQLTQTAPNVRFSINDIGLNLSLRIITIMRDKTLKEYKQKHTEDFIGLIGRDVLGYCKLVYDGVSGTATLEFNESN
jgi:hypothetical protein